MADSKRKKQGDSIKLPPELQEYLRREIATYYARGEKAPTRGDLLLLAWASYKRLTGESTTNDSGDTELVVPSSKTHWHDSVFRACVRALARIWDVGDRQIIHSISANCATFERMAGMIAEGIPSVEATGTGTAGPEQRMDALRQEALRVERRDHPSEDQAGSAATGGTRSPPMGSRPIRKVREA